MHKYYVLFLTLGIWFLLVRHGSSRILMKILCCLLSLCTLGGNELQTLSPLRWELLKPLFGSCSYWLLRFLPHPLLRSPLVDTDFRTTSPMGALFTYKFWRSHQNVTVLNSRHSGQGVGGAILRYFFDGHSKRCVSLLENVPS